jgi:hypothetical protein
MRVRSLFHMPARMTGLAAHAWSWWIGELAAMVPDRVARLAFRQSSVGSLLLATNHAEVRLNRAGRPQVWRIALPGSKPAGLPAATARILLRPPAIFETDLDLPATAEPYLSSVLTHHIGLLVPLEPAEMAFDHAIIGRDRAAQTIRVALLVARRTTLDEVCNLAHRLGLRPDRVTIDRDGTGDGDPRFDLLRRESTTVTAAPRSRKLARALEATAAVLLVAAFTVHFMRGGSHLTRLDKEINTLRASADAARGLR